MKHQRRFDSAKCIKENQKVFHFDDVDHHWIDSYYILNGYRICNSYRDSWKSMLYWHNETMNIWTHLIPGFLFVGTIANIWINWTEPLTDKIMFTMYCICAIKCFFMSSLYHIHLHQSYKTYLVFSCLDYFGISILITGSCTLMTYYVYYCNSVLQQTWITLSILASLVGVVGPSFDSFTRHTILRTTCYVCSAMFCGLPVVLHTITHSIPFNHSGLLCFVGMILSYLGGAAIYLHKIPERFAPGRFDYFFHSHVIWHCCVFMASVFLYWCAVDTMAWREENQCEV